MAAAVPLVVVARLATALAASSLTITSSRVRMLFRTLATLVRHTSGKGTSLWANVTEQMELTHEQHIRTSIERKKHVIRSNKWTVKCINT